MGLSFALTHKLTWMGTGGWVETQTHERVREHVLDHSLLARGFFTVNPREEQCERTRPTPTALIRQEYNKGQSISVRFSK